MKVLEFEDWYALNEEHLDCVWWENGFQYELDVECEDWLEDEYDDYLKST